MIIEFIVECVATLIISLCELVNLPSLPSSVTDILDSCLEYFEFGLGVIANFTIYDIVIGMFECILLLDIGIVIYKLVMWVIRKLPVSSE